MASALQHATSDGQPAEEQDGKQHGDCYARPSSFGCPGLDPGVGFEIAVCTFDPRIQRVEVAVDECHVGLVDSAFEVGRPLVGLSALGPARGRRVSEGGQRGVDRALVRIQPVVVECLCRRR